MSENSHDSRFVILNCFRCKCPDPGQKHAAETGWAGFLDTLLAGRRLTKGLIRGSAELSPGKLPNPGGNGAGLPLKDLRQYGNALALVV